MQIINRNVFISAFTVNDPYIQYVLTYLHTVVVLWQKIIFENDKYSNKYTSKQV